MGDDQSNPTMNRDPGDETRVLDGLVRRSESGKPQPIRCDIDGYPVYADPNAYDESEPDDHDAEIARLQYRIWELCDILHATGKSPIREPLSASWHSLPCVTAGLPDDRLARHEARFPVIAAIRRGQR